MNSSGRSNRSAAAVFFIVAANYLDRKSPYKWLVRREDESPDKARACRSVVCNNVTFQRSSQYEEGFGCSRVARCETAVGTDFEWPLVVKLTFDGSYSFLDPNGNNVETCKGLTLDADGGITALI